MMPTQETLGYMKAKLESLLAIRNDAVRRSADARVFYEAQLKQVRDIEAVIGTVRAWLDEPSDVTGVLEITTNSGTPTEPIETVATMIRNILPQLGDEFTSDDVVDAILAINPDIKRNTIMVQLHFFAKRGELQRISTGHYRNSASPMPVLMETA